MGRCRGWRASISLSLPSAGAALVIAIASGLVAVEPAAAWQDDRIHQAAQDRSAASTKTPDLAEPVLRLVEAAYLTDEERRDLRIFHGVWKSEDLDTPQRRATAALIRGAFDDPSFTDPSVAPEDRAEARMIVGEYEEAIAILDGIDSARAVRIRAESYHGLGQDDAAAAAIEPLVEILKNRQAASAEELVEGVRALMLRALVRPQEEPAGGDYRRMASLLALVRDQIGRLYWPAYVAEAELLYDKDNRREGGQAAIQALSLNPRAAAAWALAGRIGVESFNFDGAEEVAARLDELAGGRSPLAAVILAKARLRQSDPDGAEEVLAPMLRRFPKMRQLLAVDAAIAALRYDFDRVDALLAEFDRLSPGSYQAAFEVGRALAEARQYEPAAKYLTMAAARAPYRAEPVCELGLMGLQSGHDAQARDTLRRAAELDPFNSRVTNSLKLVEELAGYSRLESDHFIVRYKPESDAALANDMMAPLEHMYRRVTGSERGGIDHEPAQKTVIDLMPNQRWFAVRIAGVTRIHTMAASTGPTIAMESPREGPGHSIGAYDWLRVVRHEFTHTVTLSRARNRMPHWFTEAAAVYMEDAPRDYNTCRLLRDALENDALHDFRQINLAFVRPKKPTDRSLAYAQGHWMYQYMIERWGERAPLDLLDRYAEGDREDAAFRAVLGLGADEFLAEFKQWAAGQVVSWGLGRREGEPSLARILAEEAAASESGRARLETRLASIGIGAAWAGVIGEGAEQEWNPRLPRPDAALADRWLEQFPDHPDLLEIKLAGELAANGGRPDAGMVPLLERYAAARPVDPLPHQMLAQLYLGLPPGETLNGQGIEGAIPHLEFLDVRESYSSSYAAELARRYAGLKQWGQAAAKAERATIVAPFDAANRELAATVALQHGDYPTAARHITALTLLEPGREIHKKRLDAVKRLMSAGNG